MSRASLTLVIALLGVAASRSDARADQYALDGDRRHFSLVEWDAPVRGEDRNPDEFEAYNDTVLHARLFRDADLRANASRDVTFRDLVVPTAKDFQFKLLALDGRLKRVRRLEPTKPLKAAGVTDLYECWIFPTNGSDPLCLLTSELPEGVEPALEMNPSRSVQFAGYSFKLMQYESSTPNAKTPERNVVRRAPLLIGRSFAVTPEPSRDGGRAWREGFLPGLFAVVGVVAAVALGLTAWYRRGDRAVKAAVEARRDRNPFPESSYLG